MLLASYFIFHIFNGEYGVLSYQNAENVLVWKKNILYVKERSLKKQQNKVRMLDSNNISLDLLDEKLRENVGIANKNEIILNISDLNNM